MSDSAIPSGPNAQQVEYWNSAVAGKWIEHQQALDARIGRLGSMAMDRANFAWGQRVLDVGCGCGATSLDLASRVGSEGRVVGIDLSSGMLQRAEERSRAAGLRQLSFENADAQTHAFESGSFDGAFSRFGVMFFAQPREAFLNLRRALRPGGRLAFVCWRALAENDWARVPFEAVASVVGPPEPPAPGAPGPFALSDPEHVREILAGAGFRALRADMGDCPIDLAEGGGLDAAVSFALAAGPASRLLADADAAQRDAAVRAVRKALAPYAQGARVPLSAAVWLVTARAPR